MTRIILFNKPYGVLSQFTDEKSPSKRATLSDYIPVKNVYPAGRLDRDSEGLLILTDNGALQARIADPKYKREKTYWAQVEGAPGDDALEPLRQGLKLKDGMTRPAHAELMAPPQLWAREPPIRVRKSVPDQWVKIKISEGKNRQIRRMMAAIGFPVLRLVRVQIGEWELGDLALGSWREI